MFRYGCVIGTLMWKCSRVREKGGNRREVLIEGLSRLEDGVGYEETEWEGRAT